MTRPPPVPPQNQPPKQRNLTESGATADETTPQEAGTKATDRNARKGRQANIGQNTHHQGYQQDR